MTGYALCVTDRNPEYDPADIRGAARSDPGAEDSPDDGDTLSGNYPTHRDGQDRANTCVSCCRAIPEGEIKCPHCARNQISESSTDEDSTALQDWSFGRVVVAIVPSVSTYHARALGASAFELSDTVAAGSDVSHGEVKLRAAFETTPASHLTAGWPDLPTEAPIDEPDGTTLFETAVDKTHWDGDGEPRIYREDGSPVTTRGELDTLEAKIDAADEQYWIVPGIVQRYERTPDLDNIDEPLYCVDCDEITGHEAVGCDSIAPYPHRGRPIWACNTCGQPRHEPADSQLESESYTQFDLPFEGPPGVSRVEPEMRELH